MIWRIALAAWLTLLLAVAGQQSHAQFNGCSAGFCSRVSSGVAGYVGPADKVASPIAFWGGQAVSTAYAAGGGKAFNVCLAADVTCGDLVFGSDGNVVNSAVGGSLCSVVSCTIKVIYDHTIGGNCTGSCDVTQGVEAHRAKILFSGGRAFIDASGCVAAACTYAAAGSMTQAQPFSISTVYNFTDTGTQAALFFATVEAGTRRAAANDFFIFSGASVPTATASASTTHAVQQVFNNASSDIYVDGTTNPSNLGSTGGISGDPVLLSVAGATQNFVGTIGYEGIWGIGFSGTNKSDLNTLAHSNWGF